MAHGEIVANDVYVRSGASLNHYPVLKLAAGTRVTIVGDVGDWLEILPPKGAFSLIHFDYVDTVDGKLGVVNGDNVLVRAGSALPQWSSQKYARQTKLSKGAAVTILGSNPDGYLRIEPPADVTLWVSREFVEYVPDELRELERAAADPVQIGADAGKGVAGGSTPDSEGSRSAASGDGLGNELTKAGAKTNVAAPSGDVSDTPWLEAIPDAALRKQLAELDRATRVELAKPVAQRDLPGLIDRYHLVASSSNELARLYAQARIGQLENMSAIIAALVKMRALDEEAAHRRREFLQERAGAGYRALPLAEAGLDVRGELRVSALYPPGSIPARYRLVEPRRGTTIAYVELPPNLGIDINAFLGRYVGVRASEKRLQPGAVDPVPVYVVRELTHLQPAGDSDVASNGAREES